MDGKPKTPKERIRKAMHEQHHTYQTLGEEIGVTPQAVSDIVNGKTTSSTARYALAKALGREVAELWPREEAAA